MPPRTLVVEDESLLVMLLEDVLPDIGYDVAGSARSVDDALELLAAGGIDLAILDVNLGGEQSFPVADALLARGIPFLFATGYGVHGLPAQYAGIPVLSKPYAAANLEAALAGLASGGAGTGGDIEEPLPAA